MLVTYTGEVILKDGPILTYKIFYKCLQGLEIIFLYLDLTLANALNMARGKCEPIYIVTTCYTKLLTPLCP